MANIVVPSLDDDAASLLGKSYAQLRLEAAKLEAALVAYYMGKGPRPKGGDGPEPYLTDQDLFIGNTILGTLGAVGFMSAAQPGVSGETAIRDVLVALTIAQLTAGLSDANFTRRFQTEAADLLDNHVQRMRKKIE